MADSIVIGGEHYSLGLNPPDGPRPLNAPRIPDKFLVTKAQLEKQLSNPKRTPRRKLFSGNDWVRNQNGTGSCNGQAAAVAVMMARYLRGQKYVRLSGAGLYAFMNDGRDNGSGLEEGRLLIEQKGVPVSDGLNDGAFYLQRNIPKANVDSMARFRVSTYRLDTRDDHLSALYWDMIVVAAIHVGRGFSTPDRNGIIGLSSGPGNHAIIIKDYAWLNGDWAFDLHNSHNVTYVDGGSAWTRWDHYKRPNEVHSHYAIHTTIDDPEER